MLSKPMRRLASASTAASCRAIHSQSTSVFSPAASTITTGPSTSASVRHQQHQGHQRRPSSSKASCPPSGNKPPPNEDDKRRLPKGAPNAAAADEQPSDKQASQQRLTVASARGPSPATSRGSKVAAKDTTASASASASSKHGKGDPFANLDLPIVPPTNHLNLGDVKISSFFSLHRPISVTTSFPPTSSNSDSFNSIFASRSSSQTKTNDVIYTLSNMTSALEGIVEQHQNAGQSENDLRWEVVQQQQQQQQQMGGHSLEELVQQFRPFNVPPAPVPFDAARTRKESTDMEGQAQNSQSTDPTESTRIAKRKGKTYTSTLTISESTTVSGQRSWTAFASPFVEKRSSPSSSSTRRSSTQTSVVEPRQPFLKRMQARQSSADEYIQEKISAANGMTTILEGSDSVQDEGSMVTSLDGKGMSGRAMLLISVKRQRKLKMKKHKYKKLMRRTRNLRRKEGRL